LRAVRTAGLQDADHASLEGSVAVLYAGEDEMAGLKIISKFAKLLKKEKRGSLGFL
jgi:ribosomal protein L10